ncbi:MAG: arginine--tRNA ligase [Chitinophagales bacterium]|nr:arginine--tRNA ligase [Chitinophagales bacterium]MDW8427669.1 arginine--tRNA ligase [Chitinophagales bacterium]
MTAFSGVVETELRSRVSELLAHRYQHPVAPEFIVIKLPPAEVKADFTIVVFPLAESAGVPPQQLAEQLAAELPTLWPEIDKAEAIRGYVNLLLSDRFWCDFLLQQRTNPHYGHATTKQPRVLVEFCGPNTNKPLHLGHLRNIFIGYAVSEILQAVGHEVIRVNILNDRGVHICKSMLAYKKFGKHETPESSGVKGDFLVGEYYVRFEQELKKQIDALRAEGMSEEEARRNAPLQQEVQQMLQAWEAGDPEVRGLWATMNNWVYQGFAQTYRKLGVWFHKEYFESETYLKGKQLVLEGLKKGVFYQKADGSIWADLSDEGLDHKLLLRSDGTSVYITQDIATAVERWNDFAPAQMIYTVASEQDYHFKVLKAICRRLNLPFAEGIHHLSYGLVELPTGRMKSREGTVVDADDLIDEMKATAARYSAQHGKIADLSQAEQQQLFQDIGLGALKFFILKVHARKRMVFHPEESIDFHGFTGPFVQYTHARICSLLAKAGTLPAEVNLPSSLQSVEREVLRTVYRYPATLAEAAAELEPAVLANYLYHLAKSYNQFYHELPVLQVEDSAIRTFRLLLSDFVRRILADGLSLLGIPAPRRM